MVACLCIHSYTGTADEIMPLSDFLKKHTDWDVLTPTFPGQNRANFLKNATFLDWHVFIESILTQLLKEDDEVYIIGFGSGGLLAGWLTRHHPGVGKLALLSTSANFLDWPDLVSEKEQVLAQNVKPESVLSRYFKRFKDVPDPSKLQLAKMLTHAKPVFEYIDVPTFIAQGVKDKVIPAESSVAFLMDMIQSQKELLYLKESGHYICEDSESELLFESLLRFLQKEKDLL